MPTRSAVKGLSVCRFESLATGEHICVEDFVLEHYARTDQGGWQGVHSESGVWSTLFGLLLFPAIFHPVPDVFRTQFQAAPLDLDTGSFAPARTEVLGGLLQRLRCGEGAAMLQQTWAEQRGACDPSWTVSPILYLQRNTFGSAGTSPWVLLPYRHDRQQC